jgi:hypothetical protein
MKDYDFLEDMNNEELNEFIANIKRVIEIGLRAFTDLLK